MYVIIYIGRYMNLETKLPSKKKSGFITNIMQINSAIILSHKRNFKFDTSKSDNALLTVDYPWEVIDTRFFDLWKSSCSVPIISF